MILSFLFSSCREKKETEVQDLEGTKEVVTTEFSHLQADNERLRDNVAKLKRNYAKVVEFAKKNNIPLKQRNVPVPVVNVEDPGEHNEDEENELSGEQ